MKAIIVNATALDRSGALSILRQFIENIPEDEFQWIVFVSDKVTLVSQNKNVRLEPISGVKPMHKRLYWDACGLKKWLQKNNVEPIAAFSLQNTGFKVGKNVPSFIYYHQSIPFFDYTWNPFKKDQRTFWFYKNIYPYFVRLFLTRNTRIFVQLNFIKNGFAHHFNHPKALIEVYSPTLVKPTFPLSNKMDKALSIFYPATGHFYKNHRIIAEALEKVKREVEIYFTTEPMPEIKADDRIHWIGQIPYERVCDMYNNCDVLVFPSYIETYGLPLIEAAMVGMPIIAADLPYSKEVLDGYEGVTFMKYDKASDWADAINRIDKGKRFNPINLSNRPGWTELINYIKRYISLQNE